eukprot:CAMPEP_0118957514 /NCGR_PEP_ID=MMETSP1169-20130426/62145_1 /TAXON_ID=36882 /ORGANISM="Pyramimonas obovata, Strain CCMP722" /LENGTH=63 /DNA_ID=CAMNT_0006905599 /DNA_START=258 /DNA_END=450 /DNA_ORIENTATION=+
MQPTLLLLSGAMAPPSPPGDPAPPPQGGEAPALTIWRGIKVRQGPKHGPATTERQLTTPERSG